MPEENYKEILNRIKTFVFDVDGVFTDSSIHITEEGEMLRVMNSRDGYAVQLAVKKGYNVIIITGGHSIGVQKRFEYLGLKHIYIGAKDKEEILNEHFSKYQLDKNEALYMGDDIPDYHVMQEVALPCCPGDAATEIKSIAKYISKNLGGKGAVRDVIEQTMKVQGQWSL
ncbi:MAG: HAD-IIIA family hydrolase [Bacteroidota bacterium]